jgi:hypothetical protein
VSELDLELRVLIWVTKLLTEARVAEVVNTTVELREFVVDITCMSPVGSVLELLTILVTIPDPLNVMPSPVALGSELFVQPRRTLELIGEPKSASETPVV